MSFLRTTLATLAAASVLAWSGCATAGKAPADYFEPSGTGFTIISVPASGPKNSALIQYGPDVSLTVRTAVVEGVSSVSMVLTSKNGAAPITFTNKLVTFEANGSRDEREAMWDISFIENKRPRTERVPFTTELVGGDVIPPGGTEGKFRVGLYQSTLVVPRHLQETKEFRLIIPAVKGGSPITINFVRRGGKS
jgi:hypothetical protein